MELSKIKANASALIESHGDKAEAEAARKVRELEESGDADEVQIWRAIRRAVREMRRQHES